MEYRGYEIIGRRKNAKSYQLLNDETDLLGMSFLAVDQADLQHGLFLDDPELMAWNAWKQLKTIDDVRKAIDEIERGK